VTLSQIVDAYGRDALHAARCEADIADQLTGSGEDWLEAIAKSHRAVSLALLAYHIAQRTA